MKEVQERILAMIDSGDREMFDLALTILNNQPDDVLLNIHNIFAEGNPRYIINGRDLSELTERYASRLENIIGCKIPKESPPYKQVSNGTIVVTGELDEYSIRYYIPYLKKHYNVIYTDDISRDNK